MHDGFSYSKDTGFIITGFLIDMDGVIYRGPELHSRCAAIHREVT